MKKFLILSISAFAFIATGCNQKETGKVSETDFAQSQPLQSGSYDATYYDITGENARKGHFDGRMLVSLSPEVSALYVYENGNHAKIDYLIMLDKPFEKSDSGTYNAIDKEGKPVILKEDSVTTLTFDKKASKISIEFEKTPKSTQPAFDVLQRINEMKGK